MKQSTLGQRIKSHRKKMGFNLKMLAEVVGVSSAALSRYENDLRLPDASTIKKLAKTLKTTSDILLSTEQRDMSIQDSNEYDLVRGFRVLNDRGLKRLADCLTDLMKISQYRR